MDIFNNNMRSISKSYPKLFLKIIKYKELNIDNYVVVNNEDGSLNIYSRKDNSFLYPFENVQGTIETEFDMNNITNMNICLLLGIGLGYELKIISEKLKDIYNIKYLVIIEKELELFIRFIEINDITEYIKNSQIRFYVDLEIKNVYSEIRSEAEKTDIFHFLKSYSPIFYSRIFNRNRDYYIDSLKAFNEAMADILHNLGNDPYDSLLGMQNMFENINEIILNPGVDLLFGKFENKPAIVVSTGPSLNKNKHLLVGLQDKALIICPDASFKILLDIGVKPHMVVSLERTNGILKFYQNLDKKDYEETYFTVTPVLTREVFDAYKGPRYVVYRDFFHFKWLEIEKGTLYIKSSSGNMAFKIAQVLGCNPIILVGQDLALSRDGKTHAAGMVLGDKITEHYDRGLVEVMGNDGMPILTSNIMYPFLKDYEVDVSQYKGQVINCTEGGAFISGTKIMTLNEAIKVFLSKEYNPKNILDTTFKSYQNENHKEIIKRISKKITSAVTDLDYIITQSELGKMEAHRFNDLVLKKNLSNINSLELDLLIKTIDDIRSKMIFERFDTFQNLVMHVIQSYLINFNISEKAIFGNIKVTDVEKAEWLMKYNDYFETISQLVIMIRNSLQYSKDILDNLEVVHESIY